MTPLKRFFLSRTTVLILIIFATAAITIAALIPQSFMTPASEMQKWRSEHLLLGRLASSLRLHRIYTHPVFACILAGAIVSLVLSSIEQCKAAMRRTFRPGISPDRAESIDIAANIEDSAKVVKSLGYLKLRNSEGEMLFMRHPWGHWGNALFHIGMLIAIASSFIIAATQQRGLLHIIEGRMHQPSMPWFAEENGFAVGPLTLPFAVRLDHLQYSFWPAYGVKDVSSTLTFIKDGQRPSIAIVGINSILHFRGLRIYQGAEFGHAFYVEVQGDVKREVFPLLMPHPRTPDVPGYNDFREVLAGGHLLRAKYFVDADRKSFDNFNPLLVMRVEHSGREIGQLSLRPGGAGSIGPYRFRLLEVSPWTRLSFVNITGMPGVFTGFFIIVLGAALHYFAAPREVLLTEMAEGGTRMSWHAAKFEDFYRDEYDSLCDALLKGLKHG